MLRITNLQKDDRVAHPIRAKKKKLLPLLVVAGVATAAGIAVKRKGRSKTADGTA